MYTHTVYHNLGHTISLTKTSVCVYISSTQDSDLIRSGFVDLDPVSIQGHSFTISACNLYNNFYVIPKLSWTGVCDLVLIIRPKCHCNCLESMCKGFFFS